MMLERKRRLQRGKEGQKRTTKVESTISTATSLTAAGYETTLKPSRLMQIRVGGGCGYTEGLEEEERARREEGAVRG